MLRQKGHHYSDEGFKLIELISSHMNSRRLSTSPDFKVVDRAQLYADINRMLSGPSNYDNKEDGKVWVISENKYLPARRQLVQLVDNKGNVLKTFLSIASCSEFLGLTKQVLYRLNHNKPIIFENKEVFIKKLDKISVSSDLNIG